MRNKDRLIYLRVLFIGLVFGKILMFDHTPFDKIDTQDVKAIYIGTAVMDNQIPSDDMSELLDELAKLKVSQKTYESGIENKTDYVTISVNMQNGTIQKIFVGDNYIKIADKIFTADSVTTSKFIAYVLEQLNLSNTSEITTVYTAQGIDYTIKKYILPESDVKALLITYEQGGNIIRVAIGAGFRTSSVYYHDYEWDMYTSDKNEDFMLKNFPSDTVIIANMIDFSVDEHLGHYGQEVEIK